MLIFNFNRVLKARGIDKPFTYLIKSGYSGNFATRIANSRIEKLNLRDIEKLCELLQCTPNDFLEWIPSKKDETNENHPLITIKRNEKTIHLTKMLNSVPLGKLSEIEKLINDNLKK